MHRHLLTMPPSDTRSGEMPLPTRTARKFQSSVSEGETVWWESRCGSDLAVPPRNINYTVGDLYIHRNTTGASIQIWICREPNAWQRIVLEYDDKFAPERVISGLSHPSFKDRRLKLRKNGEPSWITKQTCVTNKSRRKGAQ
ncbi:hypothetical protein BJ322DRAFT_999032 [Thelephora terrestris]|uniref:Uncharacterized protein n=1 Tax=Thelephora terrestris TaxID=56493 RepID=A0A9P6HME0_9AGAM|nr:hypothetical protein BJ322DRAFT_999032 [Thelephora terrestris]